MSEYPPAYLFMIVREIGIVTDYAGFTVDGLLVRDLTKFDLEFDLNKDGVITDADLLLLNAQQKMVVYEKLYWDPYSLKSINSQAIANRVFDAGVNMGPMTSIIILQRALRAFGYSLSEDGKLGTLTLAVVNSITDPMLLLNAFKCERAGHYRVIAAKHPKLQKFLAGWLNRAYI
jgi:lysozyme family protein